VGLLLVPLHAMACCKLYVHLDIEGKPPLTLPVKVPRPEETQFGSLKQSFISQYLALSPNAGALDYNDCCFWNQDFCPIADKCAVALHAWEHNDFFLRKLPFDSDEGNSGALASSQKQRGELSYYYAHDRQGASQPLVSKPQTVAMTPPQPTPVAAPPSSGITTFNNKQSPFGTNIMSYETITTYTWEDTNDTTVKVLVPLDGVGKLPPSAVKAQFGVREFELLIDDYNGRKLRFACYKTHGEMNPEECKHVVRANRVNLVLRKAKEKDIWFDLFKKRAIGDDDDP